MEEIVIQPRRRTFVKAAIVLFSIVSFVGIAFFIYSHQVIDKVTVINSITVPSEPDPTINDATLAGVDSNNNGVRDDVERMIAREFGTSPEQYAQAMKWSAAEQNMLVFGSQEAIDHYIKLAQCDDLDADDVDPLSFKLMNTEARQIRYRTVLAGLVTVEPKCSE